MLYATHDQGPVSTHHVGSKKTISEIVGSKVVTTRIQADGDELDAILSQCDNLPLVTHKRVITWTGDYAAFIANNVVF